MNDGKEIVATQAVQHPVGIWRRGDGIGTEDIERANRWVTHFTSEGGAQAVHVHDTRRGWTRRRMAHRLRIPCYIVAGAVKEAAAAHADLSYHGGQACQRPHRLPTVAVALNTITEFEQRRLRRPIASRQRDNNLRRYAGDARGSLWRILPGPVAQLLPAERMRPQPVFIVELIAEEHMHYAQRQRGVRRRARLDMLVGGAGGKRA